MKCKNCKKKKLTIECKWCKEEYCTSCIQVEIHNCCNMEECINYKKTKLKVDLQKVSKDKVLKI